MSGGIFSACPRNIWLCDGLRKLAWQLYASPLYELTLSGAAPQRLLRLPALPWPGDAERARRILGGRLDCAGYSFASPEPDWFAGKASEAALTDLHSFRWLDDLAALATTDSRTSARDLITSWLSAANFWHPIAWAPAVLAQRITAWLSHARFVSTGDNDPLSSPLLRSLARQTRHLARTAASAPAGLERIIVATGLIHAGLCGFGGHAARRGTKLLAREVAVQVLADGGHISRSPEIHARALAKLLEASAMFELAGTPAPAWLTTAIRAMAPILRLFRHGDGELALFNQTRLLSPALLDAVLARTADNTPPPAHARQTGYVRLSAGSTLVLMDVGAPAPGPFDQSSHAGTLSFELSHGAERLIVNCGTTAESKWRAIARATAAHSTAVVDDTNSSEILSDGGIGRRPTIVDADVEVAGGNLWVTASHDGYRSTFGLVHGRRLYLAADGSDLRGEDTLAASHRGSFALRFHLHPDVRASLVQNAVAVLVQTPSGTAWRLHVANGTLGLAESIHLGTADAPRRSEQIVISGPLDGSDKIVKWAFRRIGPN